MMVQPLCSCFFKGDIDMFEKIKEKLDKVDIDELAFEELLIYVKIKKTIAEYNSIVDINKKIMEENKNE
jgi:hypothetical protein